MLLWTVNFSYLLLSKTWYFVDPTVETEKTSRKKKWLYDNDPWEGQHVISHKGKPQLQNQLVLVDPGSVGETQNSKENKGRGGGGEGENLFKAQTIICPNKQANIWQKIFHG